MLVNHKIFDLNMSQGFNFVLKNGFLISLSILTQKSSLRTFVHLLLQLIRGWQFESAAHFFRVRIFVLNKPKTGQSEKNHVFDN